MIFMNIYSNYFIRYFWVVSLLTCLSSNVFANNNKDKLSVVDHRGKLIVVNDKLYKMPINMRVYIMEQPSRKLRKVNRYALKPGQHVYVRSEVRNRQAYAKRVIIVYY